jgi:hypothetical protein
MNRLRPLLGIVAIASTLAPPGAAALAREAIPRPGSVTVAALRLTYPGWFHHRTFRSCSYEVTGVRGACIRGVVVASYRLAPEPEIGASGAAFPPTGVAFELFRAARQHPNVVAPTVPFPVSLADFRRVGRGPSGPSKSQRELFFRVAGAKYWAIAWTGQAAKKGDRSALNSLVSSVRIK